MAEVANKITKSSLIREVLTANPTRTGKDVAEAVNQLMKDRGIVGFAQCTATDVYALKQRVAESNGTPRSKEANISIDEAVKTMDALNNFGGAVTVAEKLKEYQTFIDSIGVPQDKLLAIMSKMATLTGNTKLKAALGISE